MIWPLLYIIIMKDTIYATEPGQESGKIQLDATLISG